MSPLLINLMNLSVLKVKSNSELKAEALIVFAFSEQDVLAEQPELAILAPWLKKSLAWQTYKAKAKKVLTLYADAAEKIQRVIVVGLGKPEDLSLKTLRSAMAVAIKTCQDLTVAVPVVLAEQVFALTRKLQNADFYKLIHEFSLASLLGLYTYDKFKTKKKEENLKQNLSPKELNFSLNEEFLINAQIEPNLVQIALLKAKAEAEGLYLARDLVNEPANILTPEKMAEEAEKVAKTYGFKITCLDAKEIEKLGMNAYVAVFSGSKQKGKLIVLEYVPEPYSESAKNIAIVGKGLTFDSGGYSLKPSSGMHEMKSDMAGAATVLGLFKALGVLKEALAKDKDKGKDNKFEHLLPKNKVIGFLACAENMVDAKATRPGDIVTSLDGQTIEITNTDAEGRLVLCDTMAYAQKNYKLDLLLDIATLTGACAVALGKDAAAIFSEDKGVLEIALNADKELGERFWQLPLWDDYLENMKSDVADLNNAGPRTGGTINAAVFLKQFVKNDLSWAHLDIAPTAYINKATDLCAIGGTGFGLRTLFALSKA